MWRVCCCFLVVALPLEVTAQVTAEISGPVNDYAGVLSESERSELRSLISRETSGSGLDLAVLLVRSTHGQAIEVYARTAAERWRSQTRADKGILLVLAIDDQRSRLETSAEVAKKLSESEARGILEAMAPDLREGRYGPALLKAVPKIVAEAKGGRFSWLWAAVVGAAVLGFALLSLILRGVFGGRSRPRPSYGYSSGWSQRSYGHTHHHHGSRGYRPPSSGSRFGGSGGSSGW